MIYLSAFFVSMIYVGMRAFQQLNVQHDRRLLVVPTSMAMAFGEAFLWTWVVHSNTDALLIALIGIGSGLGCLASMALHKRWRNHP